jgi:hypothetical protein
MSQDVHPYRNGTDPEPRWQAQLAVAARALAYPPTPNLAAAWRGPGRDRLLARQPRTVSPRGRAVRGLAWSLAAIVLVLAVLLAIPSTRASLLEFLQIGSVRIFVVPTETPSPAPTATMPAAAGSTPAPTATPRPTFTPSPTPLLSVLDVAGQTTFAQAQVRAPFKLRLPTYPPGLGEPDTAFVQDQDGPAVILVWLMPGDPSKVRLTLQFLTSTAMADKMFRQGGLKTPPSIEATRVNGRPAVWTTGPYVLVTRGGEYKEYRLIEGHVLVWTDGTLTYRLETSMTREDAVRAAESMGQ